MSEFNAHEEAVKLGNLATDCMNQYSKQLPIEAMEKEEAFVKEAATFWNDDSKLFAVGKELEKINNDNTASNLPRADVLVNNGKILIFEFSPRTQASGFAAVKPVLSLEKGDVDKYGHQGLKAFLQDNANINSSIVVDGKPDV